METAMKVLVVHSSGVIYGGAEVVVVRLIQYMNKMGISNSYLTTRLPDAMKEALGDTDIITCGNRTGTRLEEVISLWRGVHTHLKNYDVVNAHNFPSHISTFPSHKPVVWMCNEPPELFSSLVRKTAEAFGRYVARKRVTSTVVSDEANARAFKKIYKYEPEIINYGIDYDYFSASGGQINNKNSFIVLHVGTLTPIKNQMASIKAVEALVERIPDIKLVLAGWGRPDYTTLLKKYIEDKGLKERVDITGDLNRERIRELYSICDVLLQPIGPQGGWLAPFEALCATASVVTSREFTASSIIERENIGTVTDNYVEAILDVHKNSQKHAAIAAKGKIWVRENLGWDNYCAKMVELLSRATGE